MLNAGTSSRKRSVSNGLKDIRIDEDVKIALNLSLERFRYSDQKGISFFFFNHAFKSENRNLNIFDPNIYPFLYSTE